MSAIRLSRQAILIAATIAAVSGDYSQASGEPGIGNEICIEAQRIARTEIVDHRTILFHMTNGEIWKNALPIICHTLNPKDGFGYEPKIGELCSNMEHIYIPKTGEVCPLGEFTRYSRPPETR